MIELNDEEAAHEVTPVWAVFGDLMACLFGLFVLFFVWAIAFQVDLTRDLNAEKKSRAEEAARHEAESARLQALESALAGPLAEGRITLTDGKIGIRGSVLFALKSAELEPEGAALLIHLATPLRIYLQAHDDTIMISGFTDSSPLTGTGVGFKDNWELSAERALTVTRALTDAGVPSESLFAAGFGETHPVAPNDTPENRAKNRRVEIAPIPRQRKIDP
jgi:flagellar motor protein MotB